MRNKKRSKLCVFLVLSTLVILPSRSDAAAAEPLNVCATVPDLGDLVSEIAGEAARVTVLTKGPQDPHYLDPKPSFIRVLHKTDLFVQVGMGLEVGWSPTLIRSARNPRIAAGGIGHADASTAVVPLEVTGGALDRSAGDIHPAGNPHYLLDPLNGLRVAEFLAARLSQLRPEQERLFQDNFGRFRAKLAQRLVGAKLVEKYPGEALRKLLLLLERGGITKLAAFLKSQKQDALLGGWVRDMLPHQGARIMADHNLWPYFARRWGVKVAGFLEPKPGIAPSTRHLARVVQQMKGGRIPVILASPYFDSRHARFVAKHTGAAVVPMAHQVKARPQTGTYLEMVGYNVRQLTAALAKSK